MISAENTNESTSDDRDENNCHGGILFLFHSTPPEYYHLNQCWIYYYF